MPAPLDVSRSAMWELDEADPAELDASDLYADAAAKAAMYARLSRNAAADGDVAIAVAAAWSADVHAIQALWWERARDAGGGPFESFLAAGATISGAASGAVTPPADLPGGTGSRIGVVPPAGAAGRDDPSAASLRSAQVLTARGVIEAARRRLLAAFDQPAALLVSDRFTAVDHLSALPAPTNVVSPHSSGTAFAVRLAGRPAHDLLVDLGGVAVDCRTVARGLEAAGFVADAIAQLVLAETANFEAYLIQVSVAVGDVQLLGADLRRAALTDELPAPYLLPQEVGSARLAVREVMRGVLGYGELDRFARLLYAYDAAEVSAPLPERVVAPRAVTIPAQARSVGAGSGSVQQAAETGPAPEGEPGADPESARSLVIVASDDPKPDAPEGPGPVAPDEVRELQEAREGLAGPPVLRPVLPPAMPLRHRDIFAQDIGGQGPRVGGPGPANR